MPRTGNAQRLARCFRKPRGVSGLGQEMPATCQTAIPRCTAGPRSCGLVYLATVQPRSTAYHARIEYTLHIAQYASSRCRDCADCLGGGGGKPAARPGRRSGCSASRGRRAGPSRGRCRFGPAGKAARAVTELLESAGGQWGIDW